MNNSVAHTRLALSITLVSIFVASGYELRSALVSLRGIPVIVLIMLSLGLGSGIGYVLVSMLLAFPIGRFLVMRSSWIEGYWLIDTFEARNTEHPIIKRGIVFITYRGSDLEVTSSGYRPFGDAGSYITTSDVAFVRPSDSLYFNYFSMADSEKESRGVAIGHFMSDGSSPLANIYEGKVMLLDEGVFRRQSAKKMSSHKVRKAQKENPESWREHLMNLN